MVEMAHGVFPVPAPATLRLLQGVPVYSTGIQSELVTPTGALLISSYAKSYGPIPAMTVDRIGYGAGTRELGKVPNVLRVVIGERASAAEAPAGADAAEKIVQLECEIDDMSPQLFGPVTDQLFAAGALDVFMTPAQMKKGRPGTLLTVLAPPDKRGTICDVVFRETTTLGVRFQEIVARDARSEVGRRPGDGRHGPDQSRQPAGRGGQRLAGVRGLPARRGRDRPAREGRAGRGPAGVCKMTRTSGFVLPALSTKTKLEVLFA